MILFWPSFLIAGFLEPKPTVKLYEQTPAILDLKVNSKTCCCDNSLEIKERKTNSKLADLKKNLKFES